MPLAPILVCGCGGASGEAFDFASLFPSVSVLGIDINPSSIIDAALEAAIVGIDDRVKFKLANILNSHEIDDLAPKRFGIITMVGVATNLVDDGHVKLALGNLFPKLAFGGSLILLDCLLIENVPYWKDRYDRDYKAMEMLNVQGYKDLYGTVVIRPFGLSASECMKLGPEEIAEAITMGDYMRFARHRTRNQLELLVTLNGYNVLSETCNTELLASSGNPSDFVLNYTARATKGVSWI